MALVTERPHNKHVSSVFIRDGLKINNISLCEEENVKLITMELSGGVHSTYKPPPEHFRFLTLGQRNKPHSTLGIHRNKERRRICGAMGGLSLSLIHNAKQPNSFNSAIWKKGCTQISLIFVSLNISDMYEKSVSDPIPRTQCCPTCVTVNLVIVP